MKAEEFYKKERGLTEDAILNGSQKLECERMEAYHKAEVEAISDEDIDKQFKNTMKDGHWDREIKKAKIQGAKWFKQKLVNNKCSHISKTWN